MKPMRVAIFDIDGTIFRSSLLIELTEALVKAKIFPVRVKHEYARAYKNWNNRRGSYETYIWAVIKAFDANLRGVKRKDFAKIAEEVAFSNKDKVYRFTRDLVKDLKKKNYYLLAISHSPYEAVKSFGRTLGFNKVYARVYEADARGKFTGDVLYKDLISDKSKILKRALELENLTLKGSVGTGDTESDIAFLEMVDRPICFNPNEKLYKAALRRNWEVIAERKDVIYKIK